MEVKEVMRREFIKGVREIKLLLVCYLCVM